MHGSIHPRSEPGYDADTLRLILDQEIENLKMLLSNLKTRRDALPPMARLFDRNVIQELENEYISVGIMLQDRRARRNTLAPISRLPHNVFVNIFMYARESPNVKVRNKRTPQLAVLSYVCKHWQTLILGYPVLWNTINLSSPMRWVEAWFARSQSATLDITMDVPLRSPNLHPIRSVVSINLYRLRRFRVTMVQIDDWVPFLSSSAPLLEFLEVHIVDSSMNLPLDIPYYMFDTQVPSLRTFGCYGPYSIWSAPLLLKNLTSLKVDQHPHKTRSHVSLYRVLLVLQDMVSLQHLYLKGQVFPDDHENPEHLIVQMPSMVSINFRGSLLRLSILADHLVVPITTSLTFCATNSEDTVHGLEILLRYLHTHFHYSRITPQSLASFHRVMVKQNGEFMRIGVDSPDTVSGFTLEIPDSSLFEYTLNVLCGSLPLEQVKVLCVHVDEASKELWSSMLFAMKALEVIDLGRFAVSQFPYALPALLAYNACLNVHTIGLCLINFESAVQNNPEIFVALYHSFVNLRETQNRWRVKLGLTTIELYRCRGADEEFLRQLRVMGFEVRVDETRADGVSRRVARIMR